MKVGYVIFVGLFIMLVPVNVQADATTIQKSCIGRMLPEGDFAQFCYPTALPGGWKIAYAESLEIGFALVSFVLQKEECLKRTKGGDCVSSRIKEVEFIIYRRAGMNLSEGSHIIGRLGGFTTIRKSRSSYRLQKRVGKRGRLEIELSLMKKYPQFFVGMRAQNGDGSDFDRGQRFLDALDIRISTPR